MIGTDEKTGRGIAGAASNAGNAANDEDDIYSEFGSESDQSGAGSALFMSRGLAVCALAVSCYMFFNPSASAWAVGSGLVAILFLLNSSFQRHQKRLFVTRTARGERAMLPSESMIWSIALSVCLSGLIAVSVAARSSLIEVGSLLEWLGIAAVTTLSAFLGVACARNRLGHPVLHGFLNGVLMGTAMASLCVFSVIAALDFGSNSYFYIAIALTSLFVLMHGLGLTKKLLVRKAAQDAFHAFLWTCVGASLTFFMVAAPETRALAIRLGEQLAAGSDSNLSDFGYGIMRKLNAESELKAAGSQQMDTRYSLVGALAPVNSADARREYFFLTGHKLGSSGSTTGLTNFSSQDDSSGSMSRLDNFSSRDDSKGNQNIGAMRPGLSLSDSQLTGILDSDSLTAALYWTLTFANRADQPEEARAKIALPPGAAVSRVTLWINGVEQEAAFNDQGKVTEAYQWIVQRHRDPLLVTEQEPGTVFLQAFPVPKFGEMKVRIGITAPLDPESKRDFSLVPPKISAANFLRDDAQTRVKLESNVPIQANLGSQIVEAGGHVLWGAIVATSAHDYCFRVHRSSDFASITSRATHSAEHSFITERLALDKALTQHLVVALDGSASVGQHRKEIAKMLAALPGKLDVIIQGKYKPLVTDSRKKALAELAKFDFYGGCDDTEALLLARRLIGNEKHGTILWIHGEQPDLLPKYYADPRYDADLKQLMMAGERRLNVYEYHTDPLAGNPLGAYLASLDQNASPAFYTVPQTGDVERDLERFAGHVLGGAKSFQIVRSKVQTEPRGTVRYNFDVASRTSTIWAAEEARRCFQLGDLETAQKLGRAYRVVTPATGAVVLELQSDYAYQGLDRDMYKVVQADAKAARLETRVRGLNGAQGRLPGDPNHGTAWDIRKNYMLRFPVSQENGPASAGGPAGGTYSGTPPSIRQNYFKRYPFAQELGSARAGGHAEAGQLGTHSDSLLDWSGDRALLAQARPSLKAASRALPRAGFVPVSSAQPGELETLLPSRLLSEATKPSGPAFSGWLPPPPPAVTLAAPDAGRGPAMNTGTAAAGTTASRPAAAFHKATAVDNFEVSLNICLDALQVIVVLVGLAYLAMGFQTRRTGSEAVSNLLVGSMLLLTAVAAPGVVSFLIAMVRASHLIS